MLGSRLGHPPHVSRELGALQEHVALWCADQVSSRALVQSAARAVAAGVDGEALIELAGLSRFEARVRRLDRLVREVSAEQGLLSAERGSAEAALLALPAMARRVVAGELTPRELSSWAHGQWGHDAPDDALALSELDDDYDEAEMSGSSFNSGSLEEVVAKIQGLAVVFARQEWPLSGPGSRGPNPAAR